MATTVATALLVLLSLALAWARQGEHRRHGLAMAVALGLCAAFLPFHLRSGALAGLATFQGLPTLHRLAALGGLALALAALPLGLKALGYRHGRHADPRWPLRHKALARPAAFLLASAALLGLLLAALRPLGR
ncbi:MAG: hypothetical protein U0P81_02490 [Holophagaceae bacterium]